MKTTDDFPITFEEARRLCDISNKSAMDFTKAATDITLKGAMDYTDRMLGATSTPRSVLGIISAIVFVITVAIVIGLVAHADSVDKRLAKIEARLDRGMPENSVYGGLKP